VWLASESRSIEIEVGADEGQVRDVPVPEDCRAESRARAASALAVAEGLVAMCR
jgi:hypothetical protein